MSANQGLRALRPLKSDRFSDAEGRRRRDDVGQRVEQRGRIAFFRSAEHGKQDESHVCNRRIAEHAFEVALGDSDNVADKQREDGEDHEHCGPGFL